MKLKNAPNQLRNSFLAVRGAYGPAAPLRDLHRSLGWGVLRIEGYSSLEQLRFFRQLLAQEPGISRIVEVGFNAGHSSYTFLVSRPDIKVVSFDLGSHGYVRLAKRFIDAAFPGRHSLILGDSRETIPRYIEEHPAPGFDLAFVDGGHDYDVAKSDLLSIHRMIKPAGLVIMDDLQGWKSWGEGPVRAWAEMQEQGLIHELSLMQDGCVVTSPQHKYVTAVWGIGECGLR